jgi:AcrR family transcriptional regulator
MVTTSRSSASASTAAEETSTRRERRKQEVRSRILQAAFTLFDEQGYGATSVEAICEQADVAYKTLFNHFESKQELLREIARMQLKRLLDLIEETRRRRDGLSPRLTFFFERLVIRIEAAGPMRRELVTELVHVAHEAGTETEQALTLHDAFGSILRDASAAGELTTEHDISVLTEIVLGVFYALIFNWASLPRYPFRKQANAAARFLASTLSRAGKGPRTSPPSLRMSNSARGRVKGRSHGET